MVRATRASKIVLTNLTLASLFIMSNLTLAGPREQAQTIFNRTNGVPPDEATLRIMQQLIENGQPAQAALVAIDHPSGNFYNLVLRQLVIPWTNEDEQYSVLPAFYENALDYVSLVIGMVRDEVPFDQLLYGDILYVAEDSDQPYPPYMLRNLTNNERQRGLKHHFQEVLARSQPLSEILVQKKQSEVTGLTADQAAGVFTTRGWGQAYYNMGTNRAAFRFTAKTFLCSDMEDLMDTSRPDNRIRRDVSRNPGGDSNTFRTECAGCHAGMDALAGAFSHLDWTDEAGFIFNPLVVPAKNNGNGNEDAFPQGWVVTDDSWTNMWNEGPNQTIGWQGPQSGRGVKSFGKLIASSTQFSTCMAQRALQSMCLSDLTDPQTQLALNALSNSFRSDGYNLKHLFARAVLLCRGN